MRDYTPEQRKATLDPASDQVEAGNCGPDTGGL
jgi:hypothetical protein